MRSIVLFVILFQCAVSTAFAAVSLEAEVVHYDLESGAKAVVSLNGREIMNIFASAEGAGCFKRADIIAGRINNCLLEESGLESIKPFLSEKNDALGVAGDKVIFTIEPEDAVKNKTSPLALAYEWSNNIRGALSAELLPQQVVDKIIEDAYFQEGMASWYGGYFHGRRTSSGERYNMNKMTAAHKTLPFGTKVLVTLVDTGKSVEVKVNDRGPFIKGRVIDLSREAARRVGLLGRGVARVRIKVIGKEIKNGR